MSEEFCTIQEDTHLIFNYINTSKKYKDSDEKDPLLLEKVHLYETDVINLFKDEMCWNEDKPDKFDSLDSLVAYCEDVELIDDQTLYVIYQSKYVMNSLECIKYLLDKYEDIYVMNYEIISNRDVFNYLDSKGIGPDVYHIGDNVALLRLLIECNEDSIGFYAPYINLFIADPADNGDKTLYKSTKRKVVKFLVNEMKVKPTYRCLKTAIISRNYRLIQLFLDHVDLDHVLIRHASKIKGMIPFLYYRCNSKSEELAMLIRKGEGFER